MGDSRIRSAAAAFAVAVLCFATAAAAQGVSPKRDALPQGVSGSVVQYQESSGQGIVYHEAQGGMVTGNATPVKRGPDIPAAAEPAKVVPVARKAGAREAAPTPAPASGPSRVAQRRVTADPAKP